MQERCDIVIPVWDHLQTTTECVESVKKHTRYPYRIIIIDNASGAPTRRYLDSLKESDPERIALIRNKENTGFVRAVNRGMQFSDAAYICILNNDTVVTDAWLSEMIEILRGNRDIGIVNPSSNTFCQFPGRLDIDIYAGTLKALRGKYQELYACRAFAMAVKRSVVEKIGYLDTSYGMGYFDDIDYSKRAQGAGYRTVRAKASYVHHKVSRSFSGLEGKDKIFLENKNRFIAKWGRRLRVAYVLPAAASPRERERVSRNINRIAKIGHQVWVFTGCGLRAQLSLADHENIRFFCCAPAFLTPVVFYKIWKRKRKKKLHLILAGTARAFKLFGFARGILGAEALPDGDLAYLEKKIRSISFTS